MHAVSSADNVLGHLQLVQEGLGFALLPDSMGALLPPGVVFKPLDCDPVPTVSIVVAWKSRKRRRRSSARSSISPAAACSTSKDAPRLTRQERKS